MPRPRLIFPALARAGAQSSNSRRQNSKPAKTPRGRCYLEQPAFSRRKKSAFFGAAKINKDYVSIRRMAACSFTARQKGVSPERKKHKQGKACFHFTSTDAKLFDEFSKRTAA
jgi:hypothetical protein